MIYTVAAGTLVSVMIWLAWIEIRGQRRWVLSQHTYEGFPLCLRHVERLASPSRRKELPALAIITHTFSKRLPNGLPESDYNDSCLATINGGRIRFATGRLWMNGIELR